MCSSSRSPIFQMNRLRSDGVIRLHGPSNANRAALTARLMFLGVALSDVGERLASGRVRRLERLT